METIKDEINAALKRLEISDDSFRCLPDEESKKLIEDFLRCFVDKDRKWWWEGFILPSVWLEVPNGMAFQKISEIVPDSSEKVWLVAEDDQLPFYPVYEATPGLIQAVIGECYGFEYYLISKDLNWLLCENHHDTLFGVGDSITKRLMKLKSNK